jgi:hypothetical protein
MRAMCGPAVSGAEFDALTGANSAPSGSAVDRIASGSLMQGSVNALAQDAGVATARDGGAGPGGDAGDATSDAASTPWFHGRATIGTPVVASGEALDPAPIFGVLRRELGGIRACYEVALHRHTTTSEGRVALGFALSPAGRVTHLEPTPAEGLATVAACVAARVRALVFPATSTGAARVTVDIDFARAH